MGRSVNSLSDATVVAYLTHEPDEDYYRERYEDDMLATVPEERVQFDDFMWSWWNGGDSEYEWAHTLDWIRDTLANTWPSFEDADEWIDGEIHVIAQNAHSVVAISEYGGFVSLSLAPRYDRNEFWRDDNALGEQWRKSISEKFLTLFSEYERIGVASNGEGVYRATAQKEVQK